MTGNNIAAGAVGGAQLATGAAAANLGASGQGVVGSGGLILSPTDNNAALPGTGYVKIGSTLLNDNWQGRAPNTEFKPVWRSYHTAVWTGAEMIVWGGFNGGTFFNDGGRYHPGTNAWTALPAADAPASRCQHTAVWTGTAMVIWGGRPAAGRSSPPAAAKPRPRTMGADDDRRRARRTRGAPRRLDRPGDPDLGRHERQRVLERQLFLHAGEGDVSLSASVR